MLCKKLRALFIAIIAGSFVFGCSNHARIVRHSGPPLSGKIVSGDTERVYYEDPETEQLVAVPRGDIANIRHPGRSGRWIGTGIAIGGAALAGLGAYLLLGPTLDADCEDLNCAGQEFIGGLSATIGLGALLPGLLVAGTSFQRYGDSEAAAAGEPRKPPRPAVLPTFGIDPTHGATAGVSVTF